MKIEKSLLWILALLIFQLASCTYDKAPAEPDTKGYPTEVANIMIKKCATSGCHNDLSKEGSSGLSLTNWNHLFEGNHTGAVVVPFRPDQSPLLFFSNVYPEFGIQIKPVMPLNQSPLTFDEVKILRDWILRGAPDNNGFVKFSDNPSRKKFYLTNQGCDLVDVFDQATGLIMRAVNVGKDAGSIESPHMVKVSPDGNYWYVVFYNGTVLQRFRTSDDMLDRQMELGSGLWNTVAISADNKTAYAVDWSSNGKIAIIDLTTFSVQLIQGNGLLVYPHGIAVNKTGKILYVTGQTGNFIYKVDLTDPKFPEVEQVSIQPGNPPSYTSSLDGHELIFSPDFSKYFVTCQKSNELRILQTSNDSLLAIIPTGAYPQEMSISKSMNYLFVTCTEDTLATSGKGSVSVIDFNSNSLVKTIYGFYQPHGVAVNEEKQVVYVSSRNISSKGPAPHHTSSCGGRNGFLNIIDLPSLTIRQGYSPEVSVDPFSIAIRH